MRIFAFRAALVALCLSGTSLFGFGLENHFNRSDKKTYVLAEYGSVVVPIRTTGASAGVYLSPDLAMEFSYAEGLKDVSYAEMWVKQYAVRFKKFIVTPWFDSFYVNAGFAHQIVGDRTTDKVSENFHVERDAKSSGLDFSLGNRWQFKAFTIGCDWVGWFQPLETNRKEAFVMSPSFAARMRGDHGGGEHGPPAGTHAADPEAGHGGSSHGGGHSYDKHQGDWDRLSKHGTLQLLRFTAGLSF